MAKASGRQMARQRLRFLRAWREFRKLSQEALGAKVGLTQGMISQLEQGYTDFTGNHLELLAGALGCSVRDLMFRHPGEEGDILSLYEDLPEREKAHAIEILRTLGRAPR